MAIPFLLTGQSAPVPSREMTVLSFILHLIQKGYVISIASSKILWKLQIRGIFQYWSKILQMIRQGTWLQVMNLPATFWTRALTEIMDQPFDIGYDDDMHGNPSQSVSFPSSTSMVIVTNTEALNFRDGLTFTGWVFVD